MIPKLFYQDLGLVNTADMFLSANAEGFAVPAYNFSNMEQLQGIITGCVESRSPVILQVSGSARQYANAAMLPHLVVGAVAMSEELGLPIPIALHLDHGNSFALCRSCIERGFSSVMIDGSHLPFEDNIALTRKVVDFAHDFDVSVEGELGVLAGTEDEITSDKSHYTRPQEVEAFVERTGVDSLAVSIGTTHGAYKFKVQPGEAPPPLRFDILEEIERCMPGFPIVLHGASSVVPEYVAVINRYGGRMDDAVGIPEKHLRRAARSAVSKINIDSDGRLAITAAVRRFLAEAPSEFDPRQYLGPARDALVEMVKYKNEKVLGSANRIDR